MNIGKVDLNEQVFIIAEIGNNHEGDYNTAVKLIERAADTGVDAVKFQSIVPENLVTSDQEARINQLKRFELSKSEYSSLSALAIDKGMYFLSTPFDLDMVDFLNELVPAHKISSGDNDYYELLKKVANTGKPIIMSSGMSELSSLQKSVSVLKNVWNSKGLIPEELLCVLHCVSNYPTLPEHAELNAIPFLKESIKGTIGYSDHTIGVEAAIAAVSMGARVVEKHFTLDNNFSDFRDHQVAADPETMTKLVESIRKLEVMMGSKSKKLNVNEKEMHLGARRSIATARSIAKGQILSYEEITYLRPGTGIRPGEEALVIGKKAKKDLGKGLLIKIEDLI